jgi:hypothetical protein
MITRGGKAESNGTELDVAAVQDSASRDFAARQASTVRNLTQQGGVVKLVRTGRDGAARSRETCLRKMWRLDSTTLGFASCDSAAVLCTTEHPHRMAALLDTAWLHMAAAHRPTRRDNAWRQRFAKPNLAAPRAAARLCLIRRCCARRPY